MSSDRLTVLTSINKTHAGKRFRFNPKTGITNRNFSAGKYFSVEIVEADGIVSLAGILERIAAGRTSFVIRGEPLPGVDHKKTRRALYPDKKTGEAAGFAAVPRRWMLIDGDGLPCPAVIDPRLDPEAGVEHMIGLLPRECWDVTCWWQYSAQQSVMPGDDGLRLHLWFWLDRALDDASLKRWAIAANIAANGIKVIDPALFNPVQIHYLAPPLFNGMPDPLVRRSGLRQGLDDEISLIIPEPDQKHPDRPSGEGYMPGVGVEAYLARIGGPEGIREPIKSAVASFVAIYGSKADAGELKKAIRAALDRLEPSWRKDPKGKRGWRLLYAGDEHLDALIDAIRRIHGDQPPKGWTLPPPPRVTEEIPDDEGEGPGNSDADKSDGPDDIDDFVGPLPAEFSDEQLTLAFSAEHHENWRYVALWGSWLQWTQLRWSKEDTLRAFELARRICRAASGRAMAQEGDAKLARAVGDASTVAGVERLARADRRHARRFDHYDPKDWIFNQPPRKE
jgi:hypothetical protein